MNENEILSALNKTELCVRLNEIRAVYAKLESEQKKFCDCFDVHCHDGCGTCCEHFVPDIGKAEAEYLAYGLISEGRDEAVLKCLDSWDESSGVCPLYNKYDAHHCTVYKWRPLICRLFGASASLNKDGKPVFRKCKWNIGRPDVPTEELEANKNCLVIMRDYGLMLESAEAGDTKTLLLPDAIRGAINKVGFMLELEAQSENDTRK